MSVSDHLLGIYFWIQDTKVVTRDSEFDREDIALFARFDLIIPSTPRGGIGRNVAWNWRCGGCARGRSGARGSRRYILLTGLVHTDLSVNSAVEVVTAGVDPGVVGTKLYSADLVRRSHRATCISILDSVYITFIFDAKGATLRESGAVSREVIVHEKLPCGHSLRKRNGVARISRLDVILGSTACGSRRCCSRGRPRACRTGAGRVKLVRAKIALVLGNHIHGCCRGGHR